MQILPASGTPRVLIAGALLCLLFGGCVSTQKRFDKGVDLEERGRLVEASQHYLRILRDDQDFDEARERLTEIAPRIVEDWMSEASLKTSANLFVEAYDQYVSIESFLQQCSYVGVPLAAPEGLDELKIAADQRAFEQLMTRAAGATADGDFDRAIATYSRARTWPSVTEGQQLAIDTEVARVEYIWALRLFGDGGFRAAFDHTQAGLALIAPNTDLHRELVDLQERAVADGSVVVAFLPLGQTDEVVRANTNVFVDDLNDVLLYEFWAVPPVFIVTADPVDVRREMRRITGRNARIISRSDAIEIGRAIAADFVVAGEINRYAQEEKKVKERTYETQTRGRSPVDTSYVVRQATIHRNARAAYRVYDVRRRETVKSGTATGEASLEVERGVYAGNYAELDLDGNQLALFDPDEIARQDRHIDEDVADKLASQLADRIIAELLKRIP
jgi:hypothetical protein